MEHDGIIRAQIVTDATPRAGFGLDASPYRLYHHRSQINKTGNSCGSGRTLQKLGCAVVVTASVKALAREGRLFDHLTAAARSRTMGEVDEVGLISSCGRGAKRVHAWGSDE